MSTSIKMFKVKDKLKYSCTRFIEFFIIKMCYSLDYTDECIYTYIALIASKNVFKTASCKKEFFVYLCTSQKEQGIIQREIHVSNV